MREKVGDTPTKKKIEWAGVRHPLKLLYSLPFSVQYQAVQGRIYFDAENRCKIATESRCVLHYLCEPWHQILIFN